MRVGILDIDSQIKRDNRGVKRKYPNIACGKIYGFHKSRGDDVIYPWKGGKVDRLYISTIFTNTKQAIMKQMSYYQALASEVLVGGTGVDDYSKKPYTITSLPPEIEAFDDPKYTYEMYDIDYGIGFSTRGCHVGCSFCVVPKKEGLVEYRASSVESLINPRSKHLVLMNNNSFAHHDFMEDVEQIKHHGLSIHWDQANDITLVTPEIAKALTEVNYRSFDGKYKELFFAFDLMVKRKRVDLETASTPILDAIGFELYDKYFVTEDEKYLAAHKADLPEKKKITVEYDMLKVVPEKVRMLKDAGIPPRHLKFYMLIGFNTTEEEDLARVECLKELGCEIYPMVFRDLTGKIGVDGSGKQQSPHVRALRDWIHTGLYREQPFHQFSRRALRFKQREDEENQLRLF